MEAMEALRTTNQNGKVVNTSGSNSSNTQPGQGLAALLVMIAVLCFIIAYCCWGSPCCRSFCRRRCCCYIGSPDIESSPSDIGLSVDQGMGATPTIILLPYGRMLVVDGTVFAQLQADNSGLDLIELGENVVRAQPRAPTTLSIAGSAASILDMDSETTSKDGYLSPLTGLPPPTYNEIFGSVYIEDLPPTYDEILVTAEERGEKEEEQQNDTQSAVVTEPCHEYNAIDEVRVTLEEYRLGEIRESRV